MAGHAPMGPVELVGPQKGTGYKVCSRVGRGAPGHSASSAWNLAGKTEPLTSRGLRVCPRGAGVASVGQTLQRPPHVCHPGQGLASVTNQEENELLTVRLRRTGN